MIIINALKCRTLAEIQECISAKKQNFKDTKVSVSMFYADVSKGEEISRWRLINEALHDYFSATKSFFKNCHNFLPIRRTHILSIAGFIKKQNEVFSKISR